MAGLRRCDPVSHARNLRVRFLRVLSLVRHPVGTFPGQESPKHFLRVRQPAFEHGGNAGNDEGGQDG